MFHKKVVLTESGPTSAPLETSRHNVCLPGVAGELQRKRIREGWEDFVGETQRMLSMARDENKEKHNYRSDGDVRQLETSFNVVYFSTRSYMKDERMQALLPASSNETCFAVWCFAVWLH